MLRNEPQGDIGLTARAEKRHARALLVIISKLSARLLWMQEAGTRLSRMRELWRKKVGRKMQEVVIGLQPAGSSAGQQPPCMAME